MVEQRGSLHPSAYVPRKPRQWSQQWNNTRKYKDDYNEDARGNLPVGSMETSRRSASFEASLRDKGICQFCGDPSTTTITIKHIKRGGTWTFNNVSQSCAACDVAGRQRSTDTFLAKRKAIRQLRGLPNDP